MDTLLFYTGDDKQVFSSLRSVQASVIAISVPMWLNYPSQRRTPNLVLGAFATEHAGPPLRRRLLVHARKVAQPFELGSTLIMNRPCRSGKAAPREAARQEVRY